MGRGTRMSYRKHLMTSDEPPSELYKAAEVGTNLAEVGTDCISRQQAIDDIWTVSPLACLDRKWVDRWLRQLPPIQPEIVRCEDCKHWIPYDWMFSEVWRSKNMADYPEDEIGCNLCDMAMKANDFCSRAERRTE